ncbi:hypothetical protein EVAR_19564_1 [Eumeta japonica]|uniref:Uncharacterized protein n=1 Tax=Eumeta variegata TaxID=151549 RepID=A0A4C1UGN9_EUMVA|nr:hypothetical protein EVAR_19564_1 [Eumeta japonica]
MTPDLPPTPAYHAPTARLVAFKYRFPATVAGPARPPAAETAPRLRPSAAPSACALAPRGGSLFAAARQNKQRECRQRRALMAVASQAPSAFRVSLRVNKYCESDMRNIFAVHNTDWDQNGIESMFVIELKNGTQLESDTNEIYFEDESGVIIVHESRVRSQAAVALRSSIKTPQRGRPPIQLSGC